LARLTEFGIEVGYVDALRRQPLWRQMRESDLLAGLPGVRRDASGEPGIGSRAVTVANCDWKQSPAD
jgi:hypothetical protein